MLSTTSTPAAERPIRIGCVQYLNTLPLIEGLRSWRDAALVSAVPARLIDLLLAPPPPEGEGVDLALASIIDFARSPEPLVMLPVGMIGSDGPTLTVRLFSRVPIDRVTRVHADTESHTSATLVRIILSRLHGRPPVPLVEFDAAGGWEGAEAVLLIGDKVVANPPPPEQFPHQLDLGQAWKDLTGLPFVYAAWMCRASVWDAEGSASQRVRDAAMVLERARMHNATRADWLVSVHAGARGWGDGEARQYLGRSLRYEIGGREREAVDRFFSDAADLGLASRRPARWAEL
ncbi:MAG: menaquinone biosynthesis protein [Phycisphaeraceae bacterium]|nr:menaquinone biosynthesis protein [Phycisphaeraceae bacterium]